jgi:hypothetical protein
MKNQNYYFAVNTETEQITDNENGLTFTVNEFKAFINKTGFNFSVTMKLQRLINFNFNFAELDAYYTTTN